MQQGMRPDEVVNDRTPPLSLGVGRYQRDLNSQLGGKSSLERNQGVFGTASKHLFCDFSLIHGNQVK